jgi:glycosyltransferase involved in cell wall biosynthesis
MSIATPSVSNQNYQSNNAVGPHPALKSISLIIPAYNDETTVGRLIADSVEVLNTLCPDYEIIIINDGSKDNTLSVLQEWAQQNNKIRVINHEINKGFGQTIKELYYAAQKETVVSLPGDYQYSPKEIAKMANGLVNYDFVIGLRVKRNDPWRRKFQSTIYNLMLRLIYGHKHKDVNSIKLYKRAILNHIELQSLTAFVDAEFCIRSEKAGYRVIEIPIDHLPRLSQGASGGKISVITETFADLLGMRSSL